MPPSAATTFAASSSPAISFANFTGRQLRVARVRAAIVQNEIAAMEIGLRGGLVSPETKQNRHRPLGRDRRGQSPAMGIVAMNEKPIPAVKISVVQLQCTMCGAETHASCSCGAIHRPKAQRAAQAVAEHPEKSNRAIAEEIGVDEKTVRQARDSTADYSAVDERTGLDGKKRKMPSYIPDPPPEIRDPLIKQALDLVRQMTPAERVEFIRRVGRVV